MPDQSDVENVLVSLVTQIAYPNGTAADSAIGNKIKVYRGWPIPANLDADLKAGIVNISVFPLDGEQNVTRFSTDWTELPSPRITLNMTVSGNTVAIGGKVCCPLNAAILVNGTAFIYPLQATDTLTTVATALAALINATYPASSSGAVVTVPDATKLEARLGTVANMVQEVKRQKKPFRITIWCNSPFVRDAVARLIDPALARLTDIALSDGTAGRIRYVRTHTEDGSQKSMLYRRDFVYSVEYGTNISQNAVTIVAEQLNITGGIDPNILN